jgi:hypothetical protein
MEPFPLEAVVMLRLHGAAALDMGQTDIRPICMRTRSDSCGHGIAAPLAAIFRTFCSRTRKQNIRSL